MKIIILIDYKENFGSKYNAVPYNSGLDKEKLKSYFQAANYEIEFMNYSKVTIDKDFIKDKVFVHDSIEDNEYHYKSYMEDIVYALELAGATIIPGYKYIKCHNNKVFMELFREASFKSSAGKLRTQHFGTLEEYVQYNTLKEYPIVIKGAEDAQGKKVRLGLNSDSALQMIEKISQTKDLYNELWEFGRTLKHTNYKKESSHRNKFILQQFVPGLTNDWKILIFGSRYYILKRGVPKDDFRASGSKFDYKFGSTAEPPPGIFEFAESVFKSFEVPYISIDVGFDGKTFYLIEFQFVSFGSSTQLNSDCYYTNNNNEWVKIFESIELEKLYVDSLINLCTKKT